MSLAQDAAPIILLPPNQPYGSLCYVAHCTSPWESPFLLPLCGSLERERGVKEKGWRASCWTEGEAEAREGKCGSVDTQPSPGEWQGGLCLSTGPRQGCLQDREGRTRTWVCAGKTRSPVDQIFAEFRVSFPLTPRGPKPQIIKLWGRGEIPSGGLWDQRA